MYKVFSHHQAHRYLLAALLCVTFLYPFNVSYAVFGVNFDGWTVSDGVIDSACPAVVGVASCEAGVEDNGFLQRIIVMDDGKRYIQRIVTDPGANGDPAQDVFTANSLSFAMEDFVEMNRDYTENATNIPLQVNGLNPDASYGVTTKFTVAESKMTGAIEERFSYAVRFDSGVKFDTGPALAGLDPFFNNGPPIGSDFVYAVSTTTIQEIDWSQLGSPEELFYSSATIKNTPRGGVPVVGPLPRPNHYLDQRINLGGGDSQQFKYQLLQGSEQQASHTLADPFLLPGGSNGGNFAYAAGDALSATWIGQSMANAGLPNDTPADFSHIRFDAVLPWEAMSGLPWAAKSGGIAANGDGNTSLTNLTSPDPAAWLIDPFGPAPTMMAPVAIEAVAWSTPTAVIGTAPVAIPLTDTTPGGPPIALDAWSVIDGVIAAADCPPGADCGVALTDTDFFQREVIKDGKRYFQTIVTDGNATGTPGTSNENYSALVANNGNDVNGYNIPSSLQPGVLGFATESFVQAGANSGLSSKQQVAEVQNNYGNPVIIPPVDLVAQIPPELQVPGGPTSITYTYDPPDIPRIIEHTLSYTTALLNTGWAQGGDANPSVELAQVTTTEIDPSTSFNIVADLMTTRFDMRAVPSGAKEILLAQDNTYYPASHELGFRMHYIDGTFQNNTHLLTDPALLSDGGNIAWASGDTIKAVWSGAVAFPGQTMGLTAYSNLTTGDSVSLSRVAEDSQSWLYNISAYTPPGNLVERGTDYRTVFNADSWVAPFNTSSSTPPGIKNGSSWGSYGCNQTLPSVRSNCQ